jgi:hypothetical protein
MNIILQLKVVLRPDLNSKSLGISIRGGIEHSLGVFVSHVEPNSAADLCGLKVCDQIIDVNGQKFARISHQDAELILKASLLAYRSNRLPIKITVRYLGKLPVLASADLDTRIVLEKDASASTSMTNKDISGFVGIFKSTRDFALFQYHLDEFLSGKINVQYFLYLVLNRIKLEKKVSFY